MAGTLAHLAVRTPTPTLSVDSVGVLEGNAGEHHALFTVTLAPVSDQAVSVNYLTTDETASEGSDYFGSSGTLTFAPGESQKTIAVSVVGDTALEYDESYNVLLSSPNNAVIGDGWGTGTILADDTTLPTLSVNDMTLTEGNAGTSTAGFTVSLSAVSGQTVTVGYATANGTATTADGDYVAADGTLTFAPGETTRPANVTVNGDAKNEGNETFTVNLSGPVNASISDSQGIGTITNDDGVPALSIDDVAVAEGNAGTGTLAFTVSLSAVSGQTVTVGYATANGTATTADGDYVAASGTLTFAPGATTQPVSVTVNGDAKNEANETLTVNLSGPVNASISDSQGIGTITNDDGAAYLLSVSTAGSGSGEVTSTPSGIDCGSDCSESYTAGTVVTLTAEPGPSSAFGGWSGGSCDGTSLTCQLTMDTARTATATFVALPDTGYFTVSPCRVLDSREPTGPWGGQPLGARQERRLTIVGDCGIPATAKSVSLNVAAVGATANGHLRLYPGGTARPNASTVNFTVGLTRANNAIIMLGSAGDIAVFSGQASGTVHVVVDVSGYFE